MNPFKQALQRNWTKPASRRAILRDGALGFGSLALAGMMGNNRAAAAAQNPLAPIAPHFAPRAKNVIFLFMHGGPSSIDTFDHKPYLFKHHGDPLPIKHSTMKIQPDR